MARKQIKRLNINSGVVDKLRKHDIITCQDFMSLNQLQLIKMLELPQDEIEKVTLEISRACVDKPTTALELDSSNMERCLATSVDILDVAMKGGLLPGSIAEVAGPPGVGKTQFCIMMCLQVTTNAGDTGGSVIFIDTETSFTSQRFLEMAKHRNPALLQDDDALRSLVEKVYVCNAVTCEGFSEIIDNLENDIIEKKVKLVVIDSIASLVRKEFDMSKTSNRVERASLLNKQASMLKSIAKSFNIPILVSNQITTHFVRTSDDANSDTDPENLSCTDDTAIETSYLTAALGNTWSHCVNTRLILQYAENGRRQILIAKSPVAPFAVFYYRIAIGGIENDDDGKGYVYPGTDPSLQRIRPKPGIFVE